MRTPMIGRASAGATIIGFALLVAARGPSKPSGKGLGVPAPSPSRSGAPVANPVSSTVSALDYPGAYEQTVTVTSGQFCGD